MKKSSRSPRERLELLIRQTTSGTLSEELLRGLGQLPDQEVTEQLRALEVAAFKLGVVSAALKRGVAGPGRDGEKAERQDGPASTWDLLHDWTSADVPSRGGPHRGAIYLVLGGLKDDGATTLAANLGVALAAPGRRVVLVDAADGDLTDALGVTPHDGRDIRAGASGERQPSEALVPCRKIVKNLFLLPSSAAEVSAAVPGLAVVVRGLREQFDYVIVDSSPDVGRLGPLLPAADFAVVVASQRLESLRMADRMIGLVEAGDLPEPHFVLSRYAAPWEEDGLTHWHTVMELLAIPFLGIVPEDEGVPYSILHGYPVARDADSRAGECFRRIARRLLGERDLPFAAVAEEPGVEAPGAPTGKDQSRPHRR